MAELSINISEKKVPCSHDLLEGYHHDYHPYTECHGYDISYLQTEKDMCKSQYDKGIMVGKKN